MVTDEILRKVLKAIDENPSFKPSDLNMDRESFNLALEIINDEGYAKGIKITRDGMGKVYVPLYSGARVTRAGMLFLNDNGEKPDFGNGNSGMSTKAKSRIRYTIFVSSTYEDLREERQALVEPLLTKGFIPVSMEQFHSAPVSQWDVITRMIDECDYYILIVGGCYGSIDDETGISYTEKEYNYAREHDVPIIAFLHRNPGNITADKMDKEDREKKQKLLSKFKEKIKNDGKTVSFYEGVADLKAEVLASLDNLIEYAHRPGWIRSDAINDIVQKRVDEARRINDTDFSILKEMLIKVGDKLEDIERNQIIAEPISEDEIDALFEKHEDRIVDRAAEKAMPKWETI